MIGRKDYSDHKTLFKKRFFENELNTWILRPPNLKRSIQILFDSMDNEVISFFSGKELALITCQGLWAATLYPKKNLFLIIVFPNLLDLFNSANYRMGIGVLAHEIGHIFLEHSKREITPIEEQYEADLFAVNLGFGMELFNFLSLYPNSKECLVRKERLAKQLIKPRSIL